MRRPTTQAEPIINHFSHPHPLQLTNPQPNQPSRCCSACNQTLETEPFYTCKAVVAPPCTTYSLHRKCSQLPHRITHPCHHHHPLSLLSKPQYPTGVFTCDACGKHGDGFSYHCKDCEVSIHVLCATLPLSLSHRSHHHQLNLVFSPPYGSSGFSCDVCGEVGVNCWLYRCGWCGFDVHLSCAASKEQVVGGGGRSNGRENLVVDRFLNGGGGGGGRDQFLQAMMNSGGGGIVDVRNQFLQAMMGGGGGNGSNQLLQAMMGGAGGGGDVSNQFLQAMMGGGGNGSNHLLQAMMGGGGNGSNQLLQAMMGGGGSNQFPTMGGGAGNGDLLQALLNGSNGGVGGLDLSSVLGNMGVFGGGFGF